MQNAKKGIESDAHPPDDIQSYCLSRTGFLNYFNSLPSATPREAEEVKIVLGISNETFERAAPTPTTMVGYTTADANSGDKRGDYNLTTRSE